MELRPIYDLNTLLNRANMARSSFYYHQKQNKLPDKYKAIKEMVTSIYHKNKGRYGYRRITDELHNRGIIINHKTVFKLMKLLGLKSIIRVKKYNPTKGNKVKLHPISWKEILKQQLQTRNGQPI